jgi:hypothetical protein
MSRRDASATAISSLIIAHEGHSHGPIVMGLTEPTTKENPKMSGIFTKTALLAGALYGYTPENRRSKSDMCKLLGALAPIASLASLASQEPPISTYRGVGIIGAPIAIGWAFCIGSFVGKIGASALAKQEDS